VVKGAVGLRTGSETLILLKEVGDQGKVGLTLRPRIPDKASDAIQVELAALDS